MKIPQLNLYEIILGLSEALDLVSPTLANHHKRVAYISMRIAKQLGLAKNIQQQLVLTGAIHDIGGLSVSERIHLLDFEYKNVNEHAEVGYLLIKGFQPLESITEAVRYHHIPWAGRQGLTFEDNLVPIEAHITHLADRIAILVPESNQVLEAVPQVRERIEKSRDTIFAPDQVDAFLELAETESFWLDIVSSSLDRTFLDLFGDETVELTLDELIALSRIFSRIVDFRSPVNAAHSSGVATSVESLSRKLGFEETKSTLMLVAGYFHDIGKLVVPPSILEKPGKLTREEFLVIKRHTYYTHSILSNIKSFKDITKWAAYHHEKLDGSGYPFHLKEEDLPFESQTMSVADVFTAITEDRPYRPGMDKSEVINLLNKMVKNKALNGDIVKVLIDNYDEINHDRVEAQKNSIIEYKKYLNPLDEIPS